MGPRETKLREHLNSIPGIDTNTLLSNSHGWRADMREARLADALEEALNQWEGWVEDQLSGTGHLSQAMADVERVRAVLREVDRG